MIKKYIQTDKFINIFTTHKFVKLKRLSFEMNLLALDNGKLSSIVLFFVAFFAGDEVAAVHDDLLADGDGSNDK